MEPVADSVLSSLTLEPYRSSIEILLSKEDDISTPVTGLQLIHPLPVLKSVNCSMPSDLLAEKELLPFKLTVGEIASEAEKLFVNVVVSLNCSIFRV